MAIDDPLDEHEQSERVLEWLRRNGAGLIGGVVLGLAAIGGWKWWQQQQEQQQFDRAAQYQAALSAIEAGDPQAAAKVQGLGEDAGIYATLAALELAATQVKAGQGDAAIETLRGIRSPDPAINDIVQQRLARLLIGAGKAEEALKLVEGSTSAAALEVRGDAQFALGRAEQARESYNDALAKLDVASPQRRVVELKLTQVGAPAATTETPS